MDSSNLGDEALVFNLMEFTDDIKKTLDDSFQTLEDVLDGDIQIQSIGDLVDFLEIIIELIRSLINSMLSGSTVLTTFIQFVANVIRNVLNIVLKNKEFVEVFIIILPSIPFLFLLRKILIAI